MVHISDLKKISDYEWEIPKTYRDDMRVPVRVFVSEQLLREAMRDNSLEQAVNAATGVELHRAAAERRRYAAWPVRHR